MEYSRFPPGVVFCVSQHSLLLVSYMYTLNQGWLTLNSTLGSKVQLPLKTMIEEIKVINAEIHITFKGYKDQVTRDTLTEVYSEVKYQQSLEQKPISICKT